MPWSAKFPDPIPTPKGELKTLRDAADYMLSLPKREQDKDHWQAAAEAVTLVAELNGPSMFARIGMMRALNHGVARPERVKRARKFTIIQK